MKTAAGIGSKRRSRVSMQDRLAFAPIAVEQGSALRDHDGVRLKDLGISSCGSHRQILSPRGSHDTGQGAAGT
jgi:hypothetical protein